MYYLLLSMFLAFMVCGVQAKADELQIALRRSYAAEAQGKYAEALTSIQDELQRDSRNYFLQMRVGYLNMMLGKYDVSLKAYEAADRLESHAVEAAVGALKAAMMLGNWAAAETWANDVLRTDSFNYVALSRLAYAYFVRKNYPKAVEYYQKVLDLYPSDLDMKTGLAWSLFYMGDKQKAETSFSEVIAVSPDNVSAKQGLLAAQK